MMCLLSKRISYMTSLHLAKVVSGFVDVPNLPWSMKKGSVQVL